MVSGWERNPDTLRQMRAASQPSPLPFVNRSTPFTNPPRQLEPTAAQLDAQAQQRLRVQQGDNNLFGTRATQQPARPTREAVVNDLRRTGAGLRDIFTPYIEANLAGQAFSEGRIGAGVGWSALTAAGVLPFVAPATRGARAPAAAARAAIPPARVNEPFPVRRLDELLDRTPVQVEIPTQYVDNPGGWREMTRGPSSAFGDRANRAEAQIYRGPDGNWTYGSPHDVTIRGPLSSADVGFRSRNPFEATGTNPLSIGADDLMGDYISAVVAAGRAGVPTTDIDALLYLMRDNPAAADLFQGIARSGERAPFLRATSSPSFDDIVLAHSSANPLRRDASGNVLARAGGDFRTNPFIPEGSQSRGSYFPWRGSLHFTQNSRVAEAPLAGSWADNRHFTLARLNDVIEANPGSLGNLNPADTFFFPQPGRPLILPNARQVELPPRPSGFNRRQWDAGMEMYQPRLNEAYERRIDNILGNEARELGGNWLGIRGEDGMFPQRGLLSEYADQTGTPLVGHSRGSIPGGFEKYSAENAYRAGLGETDSIFDSAINAATRHPGQYVPQPRHDSVEFWRRLLSGNNLTGAEPVYFDPISYGFNF